MFQFEHKIALFALILVPLILVGYGVYSLTIKKRKATLAKGNLFEKLNEEIAPKKKWLKVVLFSIAFAATILVIANLQTGSKLKEVEHKGADLVIALDVSNSMLAEDIDPNRLEGAKRALEKLIDKLNGDRICLVVFAGEAYVQLPITSDYSAAKLFLQGINPSMIPVQGTNLADAIHTSMEVFGKDETETKNKAIIIITDGEDHEEDALKAAEEAADKNISIHTIGLGSSAGSPIPVYENGVKTGYKTDKEGKSVVTKLNEQILEEIAQKGNGIYVKAASYNLGLDAIQKKINELDKKTINEKMFEEYEDQFQWFAAFAFLVLFIDLFISERISNWWKRLNLFGN